MSCKECEKYQKQGDNYCRICGVKLARSPYGVVRTPLATERYCDKCGQRLGACKCK